MKFTKKTYDAYEKWVNNKMGINTFTEIVFTEGIAVGKNQEEVISQEIKQTEKKAKPIRTWSNYTIHFIIGMLGALLSVILLPRPFNMFIGFIWFISVLIYFMRTHGRPNA